MIDTHSHIYAAEFDDDRSEVVRRATDAGVTQFILPAIDSTLHDKMFRVAESFPNHYPTIGLHPTSVKENYKTELDIANSYLKTKKVYAIGEIGLDYYWDKTYAKEQELALRRQLEWALEEKLPVILHTREAYPDMINMLQDYRGTSLQTVLHSFSGTIEDAEAILESGDHLLGIGGVSTYKKSKLVEVVAKVGLERIVLETDAPYLSPVPHRGTRNESSYIPCIVEHLSKTLSITPEEIDRITTNNAKQFFKI
ncbi:MAG: TatD family hydrolase [Rikenellaceae bacterium]